MKLPCSCGLGVGGKFHSMWFTRARPGCLLFCDRNQSHPAETSALETLLRRDKDTRDTNAGASPVAKSLPICLSLVTRMPHFALRASRGTHFSSRAEARGDDRS